MDENKIRRIVQDEIRRSTSDSRFGYSNTQFHTHNGKDSPKVLAENVVPATSVTGTIQMSTEGAVYTLNLNSNTTPQHITAYGVVTGTYGGSAIRAITTGSAQLTPSFYFQPGSSRSVFTGTKEYPLPTLQPDGSTPSVPAQSSAYLLVSRGNDADVFAATSEDHLVSISGFPSESNIYARVTVIGYSKNKVLVYVPFLTSGWDIYLTYVIT